MKKRYIFIVITIILAIVIQVLSVNITPALKKIADKEINRFCQMVINNTPFPVTLDHQELMKLRQLILIRVMLQVLELKWLIN